MEPSAEHVREAELADEPLSFGELRALLGGMPRVIPLPALEGELAERGLQLDLRRHVSDPLGQREGLAVAFAGGFMVALGVLEVVPERLQGEDGLRGVRLARERDGALEVLARLGAVADASEHASEDAVRATRRSRLPERLRQPQR